jgi:SpoIIAA-like
MSTPWFRRCVRRSSAARNPLYQIDPKLSMSPGAVWEDMKLEPEMGIKHRDAWERVAVVTDIEWLRRSFELFSWLVPGDMRMFQDFELEIGKQWLGGPGA